MASGSTPFYVTSSRHELCIEVEKLCVRVCVVLDVMRMLLEICSIEPTGFDPLVGSDGFDPLWCKSPNGPQML
jgi:hypothetical protein